MANESVTERATDDELWALHPATGYEVSNLGQVRKPGRSPRKLKRIGRGYVGVNIVHQGRHKTFYVHRLVLETFVGGCPDARHEASHLNGCRTDNRLENLAWEETGRNAARRIEHGTSGRGAQNAQAILRESEARSIKYFPGEIRSVADAFGVSSATVADIRAGRTWSHI